MLADPFSFYRGSAAVMAASPSSGIEVMCCGDAHISNFGMYAAPHRSIVFDLNDFDEAAVAPAEWDVKRLITSAIVKVSKGMLGVIQRTTSRPGTRTSARVFKQITDAGPHGTPRCAPHVIEAVDMGISYW